MTEWTLQIIDLRSDSIPVRGVLGRKRGGHL